MFRGELLVCICSFSLFFLRNKFFLTSRRIADSGDAIMKHLGAQKKGKIPLCVAEHLKSDTESVEGSFAILALHSFRY